MSEVMCGTLNDIEIERLAESGELIIENFDKTKLQQACYEVSAWNQYFDLSDGGKQHAVNEGEYILFRPHQTIVIITKEKFKLPNDILGRFLTKGSLFSVGFTPVNTYADPGFYGRMGIVMTNASNNYLKLPYGAAIAKVEFSKLQVPVRQSYHGQHGFETGIWPVKKDYIISHDNLSEFYPNHDELKEIEAIYGKHVAEKLHRIEVTERRFLFATIMLILINMIIIGVSTGTQWLAPIGSIFAGIISNVLYALISFWIMKSKGRRERK